MHNRNRSHMIDFLFPLAMLLLFAASAVAVILLASRVYSRTVDNGAVDDDARTAVRYITEKVRRFDADGAVTLGELDGCPALVLTREENGTKYTTYIYQYDGSLCELLEAEGAEVGLADGRSILKLESLELSEPVPGLLCFTGTDDSGLRATACAALRSEGEAAS